MNFLEHLLSKGVQVVNVAHLSNNHFRCEGYRRIFWLAITAILGVCIPSAWILAMIFITGFEAAGNLRNPRVCKWNLKTLGQKIDSSFFSEHLKVGFLMFIRCDHEL